MPNVPQQPIGLFPFAQLAGQPFVDNQSYLGGWIRILPATGASGNLAVTHGLRCLPRFCWVLDIGKQTAFATPLSRGTTAWNNASIHLVWPGTTDNVVLLIA